MKKNYKALMENFRHHYATKYDVQLDDELLYLFIRINELQHDLKSDIKKMERIEFKTGWDYFMYGFGKYGVPVLIVSITVMMLALLLFSR